MKAELGIGDARGYVAIVLALSLAGNPSLAEDNTTQLYDGGGLTPVVGNVVVGNTGTNNFLVVSNATIPEPSAVLLLGFVALIGLRRRQRVRTRMQEARIKNHAFGGVIHTAFIYVAFETTNAPPTRHERR